MKSFGDKVWSVRYALLLLVFFQMLDVLSTRLALGAGASEGNPLVRQALDDGYGTLVLAKAAVLGLVLLGIYLDRMEAPYVHAALVIMNIVYGAVIAGNFLAYAQFSGQVMLAVAYWALALALATEAVDETFFRPRRDRRARPAPGSP
jgi:hypothetical protein